MPHRALCRGPLAHGEAEGAAEAGKAPGADVRGWLEPAGDGGCTWVLRWPGGEARVATGHLPKHTLENAVAAAAACYAAGLPVEECAAGIADVEFSHGTGPDGRGGRSLRDRRHLQLPIPRRCARRWTIWCGWRQSAKGRAVAVLGDMLELGPEAERFHEQDGRRRGSGGGLGAVGSGTLVGGDGAGLSGAGGSSMPGAGR